MKKEHLITRYTLNRGCEEVRDWIAEEAECLVFHNGEKAAALLCSPDHLDELAVGHLLVLGKFKRTSEVIVQVTAEPCRVEVTTDNPLRHIDMPENHLVAKPAGRKSLAELLRVSNELSEKSVLFRETGGVHSAALLLASGLVFREDVGRHNAVDKLLGHCVLHKITGEDAVLFLSGRVSAEIVQKARLLDIGTIVSRSAPTSLALEKAKEAGLILIGFARGDRANIYVGGEMYKIHLPQAY